MPCCVSCEAEKLDFFRKEIYFILYTIFPFENRTHMSPKKRFTFLVALFALALFMADADTNKALAAELNDVQHAENLSSIEERLTKYTLMGIENLSAEERKWYDKFQKGGVFFDGWQEISNDVVALAPEEKKVETRVTMQGLGVRIGCEWSKDNEVRKISTDMLKEWGKELRKAVASSSTHVASVINSIEYQVDHLLGVN